MVNYRINLKKELKDQNSPRKKIIDLVGRNKKVLEIGCAWGDVTEYIVKNLNCQAKGVEINSKMAKIAKEKSGAEIVIGNIEEKDIWKKVTQDRYDVIILADVLEHLKNPEEILKKAVEILNKKGYMLISIPNIAHWSIRRNLLLGKFDYTNNGLLDQTHLRFFTKKSFENLIKKCGYKIDFFDLIYRFPKDSLSPYFFKKTIARFLPQLFGYQFIYKISPKEK